MTRCGGDQPAAVPGPGPGRGGPRRCRRGRRTSRTRGAAAESTIAAVYGPGPSSNASATHAPRPCSRRPGAPAARGGAASGSGRGRGLVGGGVRLGHGGAHRRPGPGGRGRTGARRRWRPGSRPRRVRSRRSGVVELDHEVAAAGEVERVEQHRVGRDFVGATPVRRVRDAAAGWCRRGGERARPEQVRRGVEGAPCGRTRRCGGRRTSRRRRLAEAEPYPEHVAGGGGEPPLDVEPAARPA